jgi:hypothetical protein
VQEVAMQSDTISIPKLELIVLRNALKSAVDGLYTATDDGTNWYAKRRKLESAKLALQARQLWLQDRMQTPSEELDEDEEEEVEV